MKHDGSGSKSVRDRKQQRTKLEFQKRKSAGSWAALRGRAGGRGRIAGRQVGGVANALPVGPFSTSLFFFHRLEREERWKEEFWICGQFPSEVDDLPSRVTRRGVRIVQYCLGVRRAVQRQSARKAER